MRPSRGDYGLVGYPVSQGQSPPRRARRTVELPMLGMCEEGEVSLTRMDPAYLK